MRGFIWLYSPHFSKLVACYGWQGTSEPVKRTQSTRPVTYQVYDNYIHSLHDNYDIHSLHNSYDLCSLDGIPSTQPTRYHTIYTICTIFMMPTICTIYTIYTIVLTDEIYTTLMYDLHNLHGLRHLRNLHDIGSPRTLKGLSRCPTYLYLLALFRFFSLFFVIFSFFFLSCNLSGLLACVRSVFRIEYSCMSLHGQISLVYLRCPTLSRSL